MKDNGTIRLLLVDDHPIVRAGLHMVEQLDQRICVVGEASTAEDALIQAHKLDPHVVLMDIRLPDGSGVEICRRIKAHSPEVRVICLTSYSDDHLVLGAMEAGADGYLLKENDAKRIVEAIHIVIKGGAVFDPAVSAAMKKRGTKAGGATNPLSILSPGELRVLAEVAKGRTDKEVGVALNLSVKTIRNCLDRVFGKLGVHTRTEAALIFAGQRIDTNFRAHTAASD